MGLLDEEALLRAVVSTLFGTADVGTGLGCTKKIIRAHKVRRIVKMHMKVKYNENHLPVQAPHHLLMPPHKCIMAFHKCNLDSLQQHFPWNQNLMVN